MAPSFAAFPAIRCFDAPRGVYKYRCRVGGLAMWYTVMSSGELLDAATARRGESDADVVTLLARQLDAADPLRPALTLIKPDPIPTAYHPRASSLKTMLLTLTLPRPARSPRQ